MKSVTPIFAGLIVLAAAGCGTSSTLEERYTCNNGDSWRFSPDGIATYQGRFGGGREMPYVVDGDTVKVLRRKDRDPVGDNIYREYVRDGDRIDMLRQGERNESSFCKAGNETPEGVTEAAATPAPTPEPTWTPRERPNTQVAEVLGLRLGDTVEDVRRKLTGNADPFREANQSLVSENPDVYERIHFVRTPTGSATYQDTIVAWFSAPPQRLIGLKRNWSDVRNPIPWQKMLVPAVQRYGQPIETGNPAVSMAETWFIGPNGRPTEPPPPLYVKSCPSDVNNAINRPASDQRRCGQMLRYDGGAQRATQPVERFDISLFDAEALAATHRGWAQSAQNAAAAAAKAKLNSAPVPDQ